MAKIFTDLKAQEYVGQEQLEEGELNFLSNVMEYSPAQYGSLNDYISKVLEGARPATTQSI